MVMMAIAVVVVLALVVTQEVAVNCTFRKRNCRENTVILLP